MLLLLALGCGGPSELARPHDPPAWPLENLVVKRTPVGDPPAPAPAPPAEPLPTDTDAVEEAP